MIIYTLKSVIIYYHTLYNQVQTNTYKYIQKHRFIKQFYIQQMIQDNQQTPQYYYKTQLITSESPYQTPQQGQEQYTTSINELIAEAYGPSKTQQFLASLYSLSHYLFEKKTNTQKQNEEISFNEYLNSVADEFTIYDNTHKKSVIQTKNALLGLKKGEANQNQSQLVQCYQRVPYLYFQQKFVLDFGQLSKSNSEVKKRQQVMNDDLDLVQINLFAQIHCKFHQYFKVVANFDYLSQSLLINIAKIKQARARMKKVKVEFVDKSDRLRKKITQRQNLEKTIKLMKIAKSLKKLPTIINQVLASSLPYQCLSLIKSTKQSLKQVDNIKSLSKTSSMIRQSEALVQVGLNKRYADQLYLYLQQCQRLNLQEYWQRINTHGCMDLSALNDSVMSASGFGTSAILQQSFMDMQPSASKNKRNQGKQFQIAMIILQSYKFVDFPVQTIRIKISNSLRVYSKRFDSALAKSLNNVLQAKSKKYNKNPNSDVLPMSDANQQSFPGVNLNNNEQQNNSNQRHQQGQQQIVLNYDLVQKVTAVFYVKHIYILNQIMKQTIDRLLGYLQTLLTEYQSYDKSEQDQQKFVKFFKQQCTIFPVVCKINVQKLKSLMILKNISGVPLSIFKQWISLLQYWQKYTDNIIQEFPLFNYQGNTPGIEQTINENYNRMITNMNIRSQINQLSLGFISSYHDNVVNNQLQESFAEETWQSIDIPTELLEILNNIAMVNDANMSNISITILNDSGDFNTSTNKSLSMSLSHSQEMKKKVQSKFKIIKNNVLVDGCRLKISASFLLLCECIDEYIKMAKSMTNCQKFVYQRLFDLIERYNSRTNQLILEAKARKYEKMKSKNISAKNICLMHNCLTLMLKLLKEFNKPQMKQLKEISEINIQIHRKKLIQKLSNLLKGKVQATINKFFTTPDSKISQTNTTILNVLVQMLGIIDEFLDTEDKKSVFQDAINIFITRYFKELLLKGPQLLNDNKILVEKLKIFKQYFPEQLEIMQKQLARME